MRFLKLASDISTAFPLEGWVPVDLFDGWKNGPRKVIREVMVSLENQRESEEIQERLCSWNLTDYRYLQMFSSHMNTKSHLFFGFLNVACFDVCVTEVSGVTSWGSRSLSSSSSVAPDSER